MVFGSLENRSHGRTLEGDICVMDAGEAGIALALELDNAGLDVHLLAGGAFDLGDSLIMGRFSSRTSISTWLRGASSLEGGAPLRTVPARAGRAVARVHGPGPRPVAQPPGLARRPASGSGPAGRCAHSGTRRPSASRRTRSTCSLSSPAPTAISGGCAISTPVPRGRRNAGSRAAER